MGLGQQGGSAGWISWAGPGEKHPDHKSLSISSRSETGTKNTGGGQDMQKKGEGQSKGNGFNVGARKGMRQESRAYEGVQWGGEHISLCTFTSHQDEEQRRGVKPWGAWPIGDLPTPPLPLATSGSLLLQLRLGFHEEKGIGPCTHRHTSHVMDQECKHKIAGRQGDGASSATTVQCSFSWQTKTAWLVSQVHTAAHTITAAAVATAGSSTKTR